ncbi:SGNH/GDSL hydrolase family protein [Gephyromycinifex aptenodytis]|uniref:hypothetical protein n=1 Tax=Gephyromycinifex aptenodytis TaxID=2716227 RepID=UPI00144574A7|nr:hypothetical protein [Gephyromycinifex aptenodytis]
MQQLVGKIRRRAIGLVTGLGSGVLLAACGAAGPEMVPADLPEEAPKVLFIHHSTGKRIWQGGLPEWIEQHNKDTGANYHLVERSYPDKPYPWSNDPHDYWQLWVQHSGQDAFRKQPTLEQIAPAYDLVVWKHCYIGSEMEPLKGEPDVSSKNKSVENYKLQYEALKAKMREFPDTKFLVWTLPPHVAANTSPEQAARADEFAEWVRTSWDEPGDNIFVWDFRAIAAENGVLAPRYASGEKDSHPNDELSKKAAPMLGQRIVDVLGGHGDTSPLTGTAVNP